MRPSRVESALFLTNREIKTNHDLALARFPALGTSCMIFLRVVIGSSCFCMSSDKSDVMFWFRFYKSQPKNALVPCIVN